MKDPLSPSKTHLLDLINSLYAMRDHLQISRELLTSLQVFVPYDAAALLPIDRQRYEMTKGVHAGNDAALIDDYLANHAALDPCLLETQCPVHLNRTNSLSQLTESPTWSPAKAAERRASFNFEHALNVVAGWRGQPVALLRLHRRPGKPDFSPQERELIDGIAPHIATSLVLHKSADTQTLEPDVGVLALNGDDEPIYSNGVAQYVLAQLMPDTVLALASSKSVWRSQDSGVFRLRLLPLGPRSLLHWLEHNPPTNGQGPRRLTDSKVSLILIEPIQRRHALASRLVHSRLSRREVEVALCVMRGLSNADIASELSIDEKTVKDHLRRIYGKIDVRSRTAMISKVLGLEAELTPIAQPVPKTTSL